MEMNNRADMGASTIIDLSVDYTTMGAASNCLKLASGCNDAGK